VTVGPTRVAIAGSSGSIGTQTLDVVRAEPGAYDVVALGVGASVDVVVEQALEFRPQVVAIADDTARAAVAAALPFAEVVGDLTAVVEPADVVVNGVVGFAGLAVTVATLRAGKRLALANKESLIAAGPVVQPLRATPGAELVPVDSEHCAVHQCLRSSVDAGRELARLVLTASGGPFRGRRSDDLAGVTVTEALAHPTWSMGPKITVDSSTLMNKGLEVIEAHELFGTPYDRIEVIVHPQSVVHSMVEFTDGSTLAQVSPPDMRLPIALALGWPERVADAAPGMDWSAAQSWQFEPLDAEVFPAVRLAKEAGEQGGCLPAIYNAANEECVAAFTEHRLPFTGIVETVERVLQDAVQAETHAEPGTVEDVLTAERWARERAQALVAGA
jgi:1-deoxy-D-xylulose-5-phosphate reductoisomerase